MEQRSQYTTGWDGTALAGSWDEVQEGSAKSNIFESEIPIPNKVPQDNGKRGERGDKGEREEKGDTHQRLRQDGAIGQPVVDLLHFQPSPEPSSRTDCDDFSACSPISQTITHKQELIATGKSQLRDNKDGFKHSQKERTEDREVATVSNKCETVTEAQQSTLSEELMSTVQSEQLTTTRPQSSSLAIETQGVANYKAEEKEHKPNKLSEQATHNKQHDDHGDSKAQDIKESGGKQERTQEEPKRGSEKVLQSQQDNTKPTGAAVENKQSKWKQRNREEKKHVIVWREEILDYQLDMSKIVFKRKEKLTEDGRILKLVLQEGLGTMVRYGATVHYYSELRFGNGVLCNPRDDRKNIRKLEIKNAPDTRALEIALLSMRFHEEAWCRLEGPLMQSLKCYKLLPPNEDAEGSNNVLWCLLSVSKIKHPVRVYFYDFQSLCNQVQEFNMRAKEYVELGNIEPELYDYALDLYNLVLRELTTMQNKVKRSMTEGDAETRQKLLLTTHLNRAHVLLRQRCFAEAKTAAESALALDPLSLKAAYRLGVACLSNEAWHPKAFSAFKSCFEREPNNPNLALYSDWYLKYKAKTQKEASQVEPWSRYRELIENDELQAKKTRKLQRIGLDRVVFEDPSVTTPTAVPTESYTAEEVGSLWRETIREEQQLAGTLESLQTSSLSEGGEPLRGSATTEDMKSQLLIQSHNGKALRWKKEERIEDGFRVLVHREANKAY